MEIKANQTDKALRDLKLVKRARETGDRKAYAELLQNNYESLYALLLRMTGDAGDADDLTMEAFSKAFNKLDQYTSDFAFSTWLFRIGTNNCIDFLRRTRKDFNPDPDSFSDLPEEPAVNPTELPCLSPGPEEALISKQQAKQLRKIVESLKPHYRELVEMFYFQEKSVEEIAGLLEIPESTVKVRLFRARELLYNILKRK
ncbi:MAG TPA: sigma-70 family RNA polymerase sigma factor [Bacteroidales bacterium]|nr:sigma-70 family RNA polymerase sigma factor [Bacteroidales bacterium]HPT03434.1 sigma-70 family RNA polymerase sigma factor [Bacteroidales bacterium]